jgi:hypothetical protein
LVSAKEKNHSARSIDDSQGNGRGVVLSMERSTVGADIAVDKCYSWSCSGDYSSSMMLGTGPDRAGSEPQGVDRAGSTSMIRRGQAIKDRY